MPQIELDGSISFFDSDDAFVLWMYTHDGNEDEISKRLARLSASQAEDYLRRLSSFDMLANRKMILGTVRQERQAQISKIERAVTDRDWHFLVGAGIAASAAVILGGWLMPLLAGAFVGGYVTNLLTRRQLGDMRVALAIEVQDALGELEQKLKVVGLGQMASDIRLADAFEEETGYLLWRLTARQKLLDIVEHG